MSFAASGR